MIDLLPSLRDPSVSRHSMGMINLGLGTADPPQPCQPRVPYLSQSSASPRSAWRNHRERTDFIDIIDTKAYCGHIACAAIATPRFRDPTKHSNGSCDGSQIRIQRIAVWSSSSIFCAGRSRFEADVVATMPVVLVNPSMTYLHGLPYFVVGSISNADEQT